MTCPKCGKDAGEAKFCPECGEKMTQSVETAEGSSVVEEKEQPAVVETSQPTKKNKKKLIAVVAAATVVVIVTLIAILGGKSSIEKKVIGTWSGECSYWGGNVVYTVTFKKNHTGIVDFDGREKYSFTWQKDTDETTGEQVITANEDDGRTKEVAIYTLNANGTKSFLHRDAYFSGNLYRK